MKLHVIGSSSKGNAYALEGCEEILLLEAGCCMDVVNQAINWQIGKIAGCVISHEHSDHLGYVGQYTGLGFRIYSTPPASAAALERYKAQVEIAKPLKCIHIGGFAITPFDVPHGSVECYGYMIEHEEMGKLVFLTDFQYCKYLFKGVGINHIMVEANYDKSIIDPESVNAQHVMEGHSEIGTVEKFVLTNKTPALKNVFLLHMSDKNSSEKEFEEKIKRAAGPHVFVAAAKPGTTYAVDADPCW